MAEESFSLGGGSPIVYNFFGDAGHEGKRLVRVKLPVGTRVFTWQWRRQFQ